MTNIQKRAQSLKNFRNFCAFLASEHDILIHSHFSLQASASKHSIYVPDVSLMSEKQIDFVYGTVLHEVGHILHSDFSNEYFNKIPSPTLAFISNVLEDAREESLLCDEFMGAGEILQMNWDVFIGQEPEIMKTLEWDFKEIDFFKCFTLWLYCYAHRHIENNMDIFKKAIPESAMEELNKFLAKTKFETKFKNLKDKIKSTEDVLTYTEAINNLLMAEYPNTELEFISLEKMIESKEQIVNRFNHFKKFIESQVKQIQVLEVEIINEEIKNESLLKTIKKTNASNESAITNSTKSISEQNKKVVAYSKFINLDSVIEVNQQIIADGKEAIKAREEQKQAIEDKSKSIIAEIEALLKKINELEDTPKNQKKRETLQKRIDLRKEKANKLTARLEKSDKMIEKENSKIEKSENYKDAFSNEKKDSKKLLKEIKNKTVEEIKQIIEDIQKKIKKTQEDMTPLTEKQSKYMEPYFEAAGKTHQKRREISYIYAELGEQTYETVIEMTIDAQENKLADRILPNISMSQTWPEMAKLQIKKDADMSMLYGNIIIDGAVFCSDIDNINWLVEKIDEKLESIDPVYQFKKHFAPCFKDMMPSYQVETFYVVEDDCKVTSIAHNVYSTEYDKIENQNTLNPVLRAEHKAFCKINSEKIEAIADTIAASLRPKKQTRWLGNKRSGVLDTRSLWKYGSDDENLFKVSQTTYNQPTAATIMIDLSSSNAMSPTAVKDIKILVKGISEALLDMEVEHEIVGCYAKVCPELYSAKSRAFNRRQNSLNTVVFKRFQDEDNEGIHNIDIQIADNSDGESLKLVVQRLSKQPANKKMVFMISDFMPNMKGANSNLLSKDLQNSIKYAQQHQTKIYGFNTQDEALSSDLVDVPTVSIKGVSIKDVEKLEQEQFFDFLETVRQ